MRVRVFMRDGRTCYRLHKRGCLVELTGRQAADDEQPSVMVERAYWNPIAGELTEWQRIGLRYIAKGAIACVEQEPSE